MTHAAVRGRAAVALLVLIAAGCRDESRTDPPLHAPSTTPSTRAERRLDAALAPADTVEEKPGLAATVLIDVSGSMEKRIRGERVQKIEVARRAALDLVDQFVRYAADHPQETVLLSLAEFSQRDGQPDVREVIPMGRPDLERARAAIAAMQAEGGTPIGSAVIHAKRALDATGLSIRHLLVVTDGENTTGEDPEDVVAAIGRRPEVERPSIYFVAFDVDAGRFDDVRKAGGLVLPAASGKALGETIDSLLRGKILIEK